MALSDTYFRLCPVCGAEQPPERAQCSCGTLLMGVDLSLRSVASPPPAVAAETAPTVPQLRCPHADCGAANPSGNETCLYCGRPLASATDAALPPGHAVSPAPTFYQLPAALADKFRIVEVLPAGGAEAEIMLLAGINSGVKVIAKIYRPGIVPKTEVLERVGAVAFRHVVRIISHGVSDGIGYELMEYCPAGSLRQWMQAGPLPGNVLRDILVELAAALAALHELKLIHRDLKPENVLIRRREPLDLVLTDFGIASVNDATQRFTSLARTVKYGAPETLSGVLDAAADYWSLGMILVELLTGHHPFDGLSDAVITHQLVTGRVDLAAIGDPSWQMLCRGLLLREPKRRWGDAEIGRWLAGDADLVAPQEARPAGVHAAQPYRLEEAVCLNPAELAVALATHWQAGRKDLLRGQLTAWASQELKDHNLTRFLQDLLDARDVSDDLRLLRLIRHLAPDLTPVWRGGSLLVANLLTQAARAEQGDAAAADWLLSVFTQKVLRELPAVQQPAELALAARWEAARARFDKLWRQTEAALAVWRKAQTSHGGVADFDALVFGQPEVLSPPPPDKLHPRLLLALADEAYAANLLTGVRAELAPHLAHSPWLEPLLQVNGQEGPDPAGLVVAWFLLPHARTAALDEQKLLQRAAAAEVAQTAALALRTNQALAMLREACDLGLFAGASERGGSAAAVQALLALLEEARAQGIETEEALMRTLNRAEPIVLRIQERLDEWENAARINALWRNRNLWQGFAGVVFFLLVFVPNVAPNSVLAWAILPPALLFGWRVWGLVGIRAGIRNLAKALPLRIASSQASA